MMGRKVLLIAGDFYHPSEVVMNGLNSLGRADMAFELGSIDLLPSFDTLIIAKANAGSETDPSPWTSTESDAAIDRFVREGGSLIFIHAGTVGYSGVLREMAGGAFRHHPEACTVRIEPVTGPEAFEVFDEHYLMDFDGNASVFAYSVSEHGREPAGWTRNWGKGRVGVLTPGHYAEVWSQPEFKKLVGILLLGLTS